MFVLEFKQGNHEMKLHFTILFIVLGALTTTAQENIFLNPTFWKGKPSLDIVKQKIADGNDATELNERAFDAVVYALLQKADNDVVKYLLSLKGNPVDKKTHDSRIYLHWAAFTGQVGLVNHLLEKGSSVTQLDSHGYTPLTFAANAGQINKELYEAFENYGVDLLNEKNENGANLLLLVAPSLSNETELNSFLKMGFDLNDKDGSYNGIFNYAAKKGNLDLLKLLVNKGVDYKTLNSNGGNAILYAAMGTRGGTIDLAVFKYLEGLDITVNAVGDYGRNPLHYIVNRTNDIALLKFFIDKGVAVDLQDNSGNSPFMNAANSNDLSVIDFLSQYVNSMNTKDENGNTALTKAVNKNSPEVVEFLLSKNADVEVVDAEGNTLEYYLLNTFKAHNNIDFEAKLRLLKDEGLVMGQTQHGGNTPLHIAAQENNLELLKRWEEFNIDINAKNNSGYSVLQIAAMKAHSSDILQYLISKGADKTVKTDFDETVLDLATENEILKKQNTKLNFLK